jgi:hypothetical protein
MTPKSQDAIDPPAVAEGAMNARIDSWARGCLNKRRYSTAALASRVAAGRIRLGAPMLRSYWCKHCSGWHLTSGPLETATLIRK